MNRLIVICGGIVEVQNIGQIDSGADVIGAQRDALSNPQINITGKVKNSMFFVHAEQHGIAVKSGRIAAQTGLLWIHITREGFGAAVYGGKGGIWPTHHRTMNGKCDL
jgi:hypothetical protein